MIADFVGALRVLSLPYPLGATEEPLEYLTGDATLTWARHGNGLLGFGEAARATAQGPERFAQLGAWHASVVAASSVDDEVGLPGSGAVAFGSFSFSKTSAQVSTLIVPELVLGFRDGLAWITWITADAAVTMDLDGALVRLEELREEAAESHGAQVLSVEDGGVSVEQYRSAVAAGVERIHGGEVEKLVLSRDAVVSLDSPVPVADTLRELSVRYVDCWTYGVDGLLGATPEMLIQVMNGTARARVLAGTLDRRAGLEAGDAAATAELAADPKQRQEHQFAIDSLTAALGPLVTGLEAPEEPFILQLPNVWHLASDVRARLAPSADGSTPGILELLPVVHPTAAVCGTPRERAGEIIRELEGVDRGLYAGPVGWVDGAGNGEFGIALRGGVVEPGGTAVRLWAGCGIVADSEPEAELAETFAKMRPMLQALGAPTPMTTPVDARTRPA